MIVGAGPTGLAAGNLLGMAGIATLIIERNSGVSNIPKAVALDDEGRRVCQAMGLSAAMSDCIVSDISIHCVSEGRLLAKVVPLSKRNGHPLISTFYQPEFEAVLLDGLRRFPCVNVRFQHTVETLEQSADCIIVTIHTPAGTLQRVQCTYLLACDGGRSITRHSLNIPLRGKTFAQKWLVIDSISPAPIRPARVYPERNERDARAATCGQAGQEERVDSSAVVKIFCNPQRPAVSIPVPHNGRRWEFMLLPGETEKEMLQPATISALLQQVDAPPHTHTIRQAVYTFHAVLAKTFSQGRVFLLGDAAHMMPPFGGQGLNSGLRDAHNLAWKVAMVLQDQAAPQLLASYHQERSRHAARMVAFASFLGAMFMSTARPLAFCRNILIQMLNALPITRRYLMEMHIKPQAKYKAGFFLWKVAGKNLGWRVFKGRDKSIVGSLLPQPEVITPEGQRVLLDEILGTGFALLRRHSNPEKAFATLKTDFWEHLGARFVCIQTANIRKQTDNVLRIHPDDVRRGRFIAPIADLSARAPHPSEQPLPVIVVHCMDNDFLRMTQDNYIVVRPDRFILGIFKEEKADLFVSAFQRLLYRHHE